MAKSELFLSTPSARRATCAQVSGAIDTQVFLSTPSARRATQQQHREGQSLRDFYPRPPRGGRRFGSKTYQSFMLFLSTPSARRATRFGLGKTGMQLISIHALREEGDSAADRCGICAFYFYPRPPRGGRQPYSQDHRRVLGISIHALREEGDPSSRIDAVSPSNFYPRPPRGGRLHCQRQLVLSFGFLSTPSARRATRRARKLRP